LEFNVPFQHKYGYIRDDIIITLLPVITYNTAVTVQYFPLTVHAYTGIISVSHIYVAEAAQHETMKAQII